MVNAQQYLDQHYPKSQRKQITKLDIGNQELEGEWKTWFWSENDYFFIARQLGNH